jgi:hypothetical protein
MKELLNSLLSDINLFIRQYEMSGDEKYKARATQYAQIKKIIEQHKGATSGEGDTSTLKEMATAFFEAVRAAKDTNPGVKMT